MSAMARCARTLLPASSSGGDDDGDAELARRHGDDAAADAALGRKAGVVQPLARVVVQSGGGHHGEDTGDLGRVHDLFAGDRIRAARLPAWPPSSPDPSRSRQSSTDGCRGRPPAASCS